MHERIPGPDRPPSIKPVKTGQEARVPVKAQVYPGETAAPVELVRLADEYRAAAKTLRENGRRGDPLSRAPFRLNAIHAIELYLNAFLLSTGHPARDLRRHHHDLGARTELALVAGLQLRKRTAAPLRSLTETREYLVSRYDPAVASASQLNRLEATLDEIAKKVAISIEASRTGLAVRMVSLRSR